MQQFINIYTKKEEKKKRNANSMTYYSQYDNLDLSPSLFYLKKKRKKSKEKEKKKTFQKKFKLK